MKNTLEHGHTHNLDSGERCRDDLEGLRKGGLYCRHYFALFPILYYNNIGGKVLFGHYDDTLLKSSADREDLILVSSVHVLGTAPAVCHLTRRHYHSEE